MPTPLPLTFTASPLPDGFTGTPQELMDAIVARIAIETSESFVLVGTGPVLPVSDQGPFLLNGTTWYVWDSVSGSYIPATIEFLSQINSKPFRANAASAQTIVQAGPGASSLDLAFTEEFDPDGVFGSDTFIAPDSGFYNIKSKIGISATSGTPTDITILFYLKKNGFQMPRETVFTELGDVYAGRTFYIDTIVQLSAGDAIRPTVGVSIGGGTATWTITENDTWVSGSKIRNTTYTP